MKKHKINILITIFIVVILIISPCISNAAENDKTEDNDKHFYTLEELIFGKIPILDVNIFNTSDIEENSIAMTIRNAVATWYISARNISTVILAFVIVYIGIRLAISTVASDKANYKQMLINWITALIIIYFIHFVMIIVLNLNDTLVSMLSEVDRTSELPIYETIITRTKDLRWSVGIPAAIMYWVLVIYFLMFLWVYLKRLFTVLILIIVAPFVGTKYAIDSAGKGKKSKIFLTWLYEFTMNVLLQSVHALLYVVLMNVAIELALTSIFGIILALIFINFILKADKIFMNIFNFGRSKLVRDIAEPMQNPREQFATALFLGGTALDFAGGVKNIAVGGARQLGRIGKNSYIKYVDEDTRKKITKTKDKALDKIDSTLNSAYKKVTKKDSNYLVLAMMSRKKDSTGVAAKKQLRKAKANIKAKFTAPFKFIKQAGGGILMVGVGIPMTVVNPGVGTGMVLGGVSGIWSMGSPTDKKGNKYEGAEYAAQKFTLGAYGTNKELSKDTKKVGQAVDYLKKARLKESEIEKLFQERFSKSSDEAIEKYKKEISFYITYADKDNINMILREGLAGKGILNIDDGNISSVIEDMADYMFKELGIEEQYSSEQAYRIKKAMIEKTKKLYEERKSEAEVKLFGSLDMSEAFSDAIKEEGISKEFDYDYMQGTMRKTLEDNNISEITIDNLEETVNRYTTSVVNEMQMDKKAYKGFADDLIKETNEKAKRIINERKEKIKSLKDMANSKNTDESDVAKKIINENRFFSEKEITDMVDKVIFSRSKDLNINFGYGELTEKIEELHEINKQAEDDVKAPVVKENHFINSLNKNNSDNK